MIFFSNSAYSGFGTVLYNYKRQFYLRKFL
jgi:hypothetical protein